MDEITMMTTERSPLVTMTGKIILPPIERQAAKGFFIKLSFSTGEKVSNVMIWEPLSLKFKGQLSDGQKVTLVGRYQSGDGDETFWCKNVITDVKPFDRDEYLNRLYGSKDAVIKAEQDVAKDWHKMGYKRCGISFNDGKEIKYCWLPREHTVTVKMTSAKGERVKCFSKVELACDLTTPDYVSHEIRELVGNLKQVTNDTKNHTFHKQEYFKLLDKIILDALKYYDGWSIIEGNEQEI